MTSFVTQTHKMVKISILIILISHLFGTMVHCATPCSEYFTYIIRPETGILGQIEIPSPSENGEFYLRVALNSVMMSPSKDAFVRLQLARPIKESILAIRQGRPLSYHIYFPSLNLDEPIPTVSAIWFNNLKYCSGNGIIRATIELGHVVYPPNNVPFFWQNSSESIENLLYRNISIYRINNPNHYRLNYLHLIYSNPTTDFWENNENRKKPMKTHQSSNDSNDNKNTNNNSNDNNNNTNINNDECGISSRIESTINVLIFNGQKTSTDQWPWLVALFIARNDEYNFQCGGTILSNRHVLTAGHCLTFNSTETIPSNVLIVALGRFKLHEWKEGTVNRKIASYKVHPDYVHTGTTSDSDLAILILRTAVEYSPSIRPVCLWSSNSTNLQNIIGKTGYIVGWGEDEAGHPYTEEPRMAKVSIASNEDCLWSHPLFVTITSKRTFCAGSPNIPCNGDSGSGLVLHDETTNRYQLRGVISRSVASARINTKSFCDPTKYVVYVDVAKYLPWIQQQISNT
ncbi:PREDICTED: transmembrane protease serine 11D-like isoform X1 [Acromyrmex echinatior]|uniref:transmembrane protease serine 11D-like isoform X1 n=1 Tax=Acromyrmex echinatior TaxID=103372 RepID=UPI000580D943|nr:PREDICTED: transmembrane protease serine 11D-like isoform X1 [Acromyrmex echinatior]XP_011057379.1 PREDICTED: transmembrane protease serine 11D-like isoform X1 [Acromyrmex echinatior]